MKNNIILYLSLVLVLFPSVSFAVVNLPWSTTYNCNEWKTSDGQNPNCDGLWEGGGWTCDNGDGTHEEEQITAAANYSSGGGGKGQRHWLGDGVNNISGGMSASFLSSQPEIWVRWYMRYEQGFEWNPYLMNQKILYFDPVSFPRLIVEYYGQDKVQIYSYASSQGYPSAEGNGWNTMMANGGTDARGNKTSDGQWHLWEFHVKIDTNGTDGILELWIDNNMVINATNANLAAAPLTTLLIGSNGFTPGNGRCMFVDYDDIAISTTGPIGGGVDAQAPSVPAGLSAQAVSSSQINLSWTASTDNVGVAGYRVYRNGSQIDTTSTTSYSNTGLSPSTTYTYSVSAYDAVGNNSAQTPNVSATTQAQAGGGGGDTGGGDASGGSGCGYIKDNNGKGQKANSEGLNMIMLFLLLILLMLSKARYRRLFMRRFNIIFLAGIFLFLNANISLAAVNLPWSTTYNCPDWKQSDGLYGVVNCDGLTGDGGWTCDNGDGTAREEQITAAANYPAGGGGKGQRHWLGDGINNVSGGMRISLTSLSPELWIRWHMRYENGFTWLALNNQKILYINVAGPNAVIPQYAWSDETRVSSRDFAGYYSSGPGGGWNTIMAAGATDVRGNKASDGQWHRYEVHIKTDTNGSDGIAEMWIDGIRRVGVTNANFGGRGWDDIVIGSNGFEAINGRCMAVDYDDIAISNTGPIGPIGGGNQNTGEDASSSSGSGCGFVKDINGKGQGAKGEGLSFAMMIIISLMVIPIIRRIARISDTK